jgi:DNA-directed RNA polymerase beta' subunit
LAAIPYQVLTPVGPGPLIGIYQDSLLGSYRFTRPNVKLTPREAMNLLAMFPRVNVEKLLENKDHLTSFDVLTQILPDMTLKTKKEDNVVEIRNGKYVSGQLDKSILGASTKGLIHRIYNDYGPFAATDFIDDLQQVVTEYMKTSSFSVGISDLIANKVTQEKIVQIITEKKMEVQSELDKLHLGIFKNDTSNSNMVQFETTVNNILNKATELSGKEGRKSLSKDNRFLMIVESGSKGTLVNISQMISCLGQTNVDGKRISYGFEDRTLPHFKKFDDSPGARGFIENSYISGLTAPELFFHAMGGRIGLIDTAVKTSSTGYIQRRLIKGLEDLKVEYDLTVRNNRGKIVQFAYGDDGIDSTRVEAQGVPLVGMSVEDVYMHYDIAGISEESTKEMTAVYTKGTATRIKKQKRETVEKVNKYIERMLEQRDALVKGVFRHKDDTMVKVPVSFQHIITNLQGQLGLNSSSSTDVTPLEAFDMIEQTFEKLKKLTFAPPTKLFEILYYFYLTPRDLLVHKRFHRKGLELLLDTVFMKYKQSIVHPGEMVGVVAGQSIGEPTTQLTLNSVTYETEIVVRNSKNQIKKVQIGDFVTEHMKKSKRLEYMEDKDTTYAELCPEEEYYEVPSATEDGRTVWTRIEAVTQHPVINEDGTDTMIKITTEGCREVIVTKAKSVLQLVDGKILPFAGGDLRVGDYMSVSIKPLDFDENYYLDLRRFLSPKEYLYGSEYHKAKTFMNEHHWWSKHAGKEFVVPHSRSDLFVTLTKADKCFNESCVYMKLVNMCDYCVPAEIPLDYDFGYLVGAYCAEGCMTKHQISISNNDLEYFRPIQRICEKWNLTTKIYCVTDKNHQGWTSQDIRIYNTILCRILEVLCGKLSHNKFVSDRIVFSNRECMLGFLDAYIGGDGCISKVTGSERINDITISSVSHRMLTDVSLILRNLGIFSKMNKPKKQETNNRRSRDIKQLYNIRISNQQAHKLGAMLHLAIKSKQDRIHTLLTQSYQYEYNKAYLTIPNKINGEIVFQPRENKIPDLIFDKIVKIEEVPNTTKYAYDLTVAETRNFDCVNGLNLVDTFHLAGVASKSNVTRGVPRIEEILRLTDNPKKPAMTIHLKSVDEADKDRATVYANMLEHTVLRDVVKSVQICFDPLERSTFIESDKNWMETFYAFEDMMKECNEDEDESAARSKWVVRMELDAEALLERNITMDDVHFAIKNVHSDIQCIYSDYNDEELVFRMRTNADMFKKKKGALQSLDQSDEIYLLRNFQDGLLNNIVLRGVQGIENVLPRKLQNMVAKEDGKYVKKDTWVLDTTGTNMLDVLGTDFIDFQRTYSNDIGEVFDVLGIEAARQIIFNEFSEVMEFSDVNINYHHLSLLCDRMTVTKDMVAIFRSGLHNDNIGPIAKATFEVHTEILLQAARHADFDEMRGVSANVMCGQFGYYGTGAFNVILDMNEMAKQEAKDALVRHDAQDIESGFSQKEDLGCGNARLQIQNNIKAIHQENEGVCQDQYDMGF